MPSCATRAVSSLLFWSLFTTPALAQSVDQALPKVAVEMALWNADVTAMVRSGADPHVVARAVHIDPETGETTPAEGPTVELRQKGTLLEIVRAATAEDVWLEVEVTLDAALPVKIGGSSLRVDVQASVDAGELERLLGPAPAGKQPGVTLALVDSRAELSGLFAAHLEGDGSVFTSRHGTGELELVLDGGEAKVQQHEGDLRLENKNGKVEVYASEGRISYQLAGGQLEISESMGTVEGKSADAGVSLVDFQGQATMESSGGHLELRSFRSGDQKLVVAARRSEVILDGLASGEAKLEQEGGTLDVSRCQADVTLKASKQASIRLSQISNAWTMDLTDGEAEVTDAQRLTAKVVGSRLDITDVGELELRASASEVVASGVRTTLERLIFSEATADIELAGEGRRELNLRGSTQVTVRVPTPCFVRSVTGGEVQASGCELLEGTASAADSAGATFLTFSIDDSSRAEVFGL